ncbi:MAG: hypothetical protein ACJAS7_000952 [Alpinimonas sp.]|jgi:hypothetical protein
MGIEVNFSALGPNRSHDHVECDLRQLALVDRVIGLEAQLAYLKSAQATNDAGDAHGLKSSMTWRVGRAVLMPVRFAKKVLRRATK